MPDRNEPRTPEDLRNAMSGRPAGPLSASPNDERPASVTFPAIVATGIGFVGLLCCGAMSGVFGIEAMSSRPGGQPTPEDVAVAQFSVGAAAVYTICCGALVAAGFGAMWLRSWAWFLGLTVSPLLIVAAVVRLYFELTWLGPYKLEMSQAEVTRAATAPTVGLDVIRQATPVIAIVTFIIQLIAPVLILTLWTRPAAREAFARAKLRRR